LRRFAIITAGGSGTRMGAALPKQFLELQGLPILMHTINVFHRFDASMKLIVTLPREHQILWIELTQKYKFTTPHLMLAGGATRFDSVKNALKNIGGDGVVGIHDGVRPLVSHETLTRCYQTAEEKGNALPVMDVVESLRKIDNETSMAVNRAAYKSVQTPQVFNLEMIKSAYNQPFQDSFTDDATVAESQGEIINLVEGNPENIKITTSIDLEIADFLWKKIYG